MTDIGNNEAFIAKLRKLMAMTTERGASFEEAATASGMVQRMLSERGLTMAQIAGRVNAGEAGANEKRSKQKHDRSAMYKYQQDLMRALAKNNFCMYFLEEETAHSFGKDRLVKRHVLLGRESNVVGTTLMYDYLVETMDRLVEEYGCTGMEKRGKRALAWLTGCGERLVERLDALREEMERESQKAKEAEEKRQRHPAYASTGSALVVLSDVYGSEGDLNNDALHGYEPGTTAQRNREWEAERTAETARREALAAKLKTEGVGDDVAFWMIHYGYNLDRATRRQAEYAAEEAKSAKRRARSGGGRSYRYTEKDRREDERRQSDEFKSGQLTGDKISLNKQVDEQKTRRIK